MKHNEKQQAKLRHQFSSTCGWCVKHISEDTVVFWGGARVRPGVDLREFEGQILKLRQLLEDRVVLALVPTSDSEAKRHGDDLMFLTCSKKCAARLKRALSEEIDLGNLLGLPEPGE